MLQPVKVDVRDLDLYRGIANDDVLDEIRELAGDLHGLRLLHVNATARGGGVAELLTSLVPLMRNVGIEAEWRVIFGEQRFFKVTKAIHNALQGQRLDIDPSMQKTFLEFSHLNAKAFEGDWDVVVVHDPQPAPLPRLLSRHGGRHWVWHCHLDLTHPDAAAASFLLPFLQDYDASVFSSSSYAMGYMPGRRYDFAPCIDPLLTKNQPCDKKEGGDLLRSLGIEQGAPLVAQVSRFDPWKDPLGAIEVYRKVKRDIPALRLALVGSIADDDPQGWDYYEHTARFAGLDYDIHILHDHAGADEHYVRVFQTMSDVILQMSKREGFGLTVTEALWKKRCVVASDVGGIRMQIEDGVNGFLASDYDESARRVRESLENPSEAAALGERGAQTVRKHFLTPRLLRDYLRVLRDLTARGGAPLTNGGG